MNFKKLVIASRLKAVAKQSLTIVAATFLLAACGDDKSSNSGDVDADEEFEYSLSDLAEWGISVIDEVGKLGKCTPEDEFKVVYIKADHSFFVCSDGNWTDDFSTTIPMVESEKDLGECNEKNEGEMFRVPRDTIFDTYACENGEWVSDFGGNDGMSVDPKTVGKGTFTDERDGKTYKTVKIGDQTWMAENLNYDSDGSSCYDNDNSYCEQYGRLYAPADVKSSSICPNGWRLPTIVEWNTLYKNMGNNLYIGLTDPYEFNISLGGYRDKNLDYSMMGLIAGYWVRSGSWLIGVMTVNTRSRSRKSDSPWTSVPFVDSNYAMYMRCIKK